MKKLERKRQAAKPCLKFGNIMSRIGKQPIAIPEKTEVAVSDSTVRVKGPLGELSKTFNPEVAVAVADGVVTVTPQNDTGFAQALWGTVASQIKSMVSGVNEAFSKKLVIEGVGYRAAVNGDKLELSIGYSHPVVLAIPAGITVVVEKNEMTISGFDKELVGQFAANVRAKRKPEPYKGKGIRYRDEIIRRKQGKRAVA